MPRKQKANCSLCGVEILSNVDPNRDVICSECVQGGTIVEPSRELRVESEYVPLPGKTWNQRCRESIEKEKTEVQKEWGIRIGQTNITCTYCNKSIGWPNIHTCPTKPTRPKDQLTIGHRFNQEKWEKAIKKTMKDYDIRPAKSKNTVSSRRIAILFGEEFLRLGGGLALVPIVEKDMYDLAMELQLRCDPLERELKVKPEWRSTVLTVWGVSKLSGMEQKTISDLKEWTKGVLQPKDSILPLFQGDVSVIDGKPIVVDGKPSAVKRQSGFFDSWEEEEEFYYEGKF